MKNITNLITNPIFFNFGTVPNFNSFQILKRLFVYVSITKTLFTFYEFPNLEINSNSYFIIFNTINVPLYFRQYLNVVHLFYCAPHSRVVPYDFVLLVLVPKSNPWIGQSRNFQQLHSLFSHLFVYYCRNCDYFVMSVSLHLHLHCHLPRYAKYHFVFFLFQYFVFQTVKKNLITN